VARFPDHNIAISGLGTALQCLGRFDEADEILSDAVSRLQGAADVAVEYARVAHRRGDWTEALRRWTLVMSRFPDDAAGVEGACVALERLKRFDEWDQLLGSAVARFANRATFAADYARAATRRSDWLEARRRWEAAQSRFPNDRAIREGFGATELRLRLDIIDSDGAREPDDVVEKTPTGLGCSPRELMMRFESLGSGCAFGLVQRHFGAEPLGLLRWGAIPPAALARALDQGFEGIGNPDNVRVFEFYNSKEYFFRDVFYSLEMHTFVSMNDVPIERMTKQMIRRVTYLADKLKMDLALPRDEAKIYVYKNHTGSMSMNEVNLIFRSLRRYGKHTLLCIRSADDEHAEGVVEVVEDGLLIGRLDGLEASNSNAANGVRYEAWFDVCARAHEIWSKAIADDPA
jgi:tetratricopeptide (TPR) repeat protein